MSDENTAVSHAEPSDKDRIAALESELARMRTNPRNLPTVQQCNVCGEKPDPETGRCPRHPFDRVNHVRDGVAGEPDFVLVKQV